MTRKLALALMAGVVLAGASGAALAHFSGEAFMAPVRSAGQEAIRENGGRGIEAVFAAGPGWLSRHPVLRGGDGLPDDTRASVARALATVPGVGGVRWERSDRHEVVASGEFDPLHCQQVVEGLLKSRSIRFQEGSAALVSASDLLLDEVAEALRPCAGAIIAITGHTDRSGSESANQALSMERARAVREALVRRGIPRADLRARGFGSERLADDLAPTDPANRRIEFSVVRKKSLVPTPIDTPQAW